MKKATLDEITVKLPEAWEEQFDEWWNTEDALGVFMERYTTDDFEDMANYIKAFISKLFQSK